MARLSFYSKRENCRCFIFSLSSQMVRLPWWLSPGKASAYNAGDPGSIPGSGRSSVEGNGNRSMKLLREEGRKTEGKRAGRVGKGSSSYWEGRGHQGQ